VHTHMTNTRNTPVEALEAAYPLRVRRLGLRRGSGGVGRHPGGDGIVKEVELLAEAAVLTLVAERRTHRPRGVDGGGDGGTGADAIMRDGERIPLPSKCRAVLRRGDVVVVETPGGGGWGAP